MEQKISNANNIQPTSYEPKNKSFYQQNFKVEVNNHSKVLIEMYKKLTGSDLKNDDQHKTLKQTNLVSTFLSLAKTIAFNQFVM